jgi:hypothetical protein
MVTALVIGRWESSSDCSTVDLREAPLRDAVNSWIGHLFEPTTVDRTAAAFVASQEGRSKLLGHTVPKAAGRRRGAPGPLPDSDCVGIDPAVLVWWT